MRQVRRLRRLARGAALACVLPAGLGWAATLLPSPSDDSASQIRVAVATGAGVEEQRAPLFRIDPLGGVAVLPGHLQQRSVYALAQAQVAADGPWPASKPPSPWLWTGSAQVQHQRSARGREWDVCLLQTQLGISHLSRAGTWAASVEWQQIQAGHSFERRQPALQLEWSQAAPGWLSTLQFSASRPSHRGEWTELDTQTQGLSWVGQWQGSGAGVDQLQASVAALRERSRAGQPAFSQNARHLQLQLGGAVPASAWRWGVGAGITQHQHLASLFEPMAAGRRDRGGSLDVSLSRPLADGWTLQGQLSTSVNRSTVLVYTFRAHQMEWRLSRSLSF